MEEPIQLQPTQQVALEIENPTANAGDLRDELPSLGQEDALEKELATHSSIRPWKTHGHRSLAGYSPWGHRVRHNCSDLAGMQNRNI